VFDQREELPLLPFGNPIGFVPASRGGVNLKSMVNNEVGAKQGSTWPTAKRNVAQLDTSTIESRTLLESTEAGPSAFPTGYKKA